MHHYPLDADEPEVNEPEVELPELEKSFLSEQILTLIPQNQSYFWGLGDLVMDQIK